MHCISLDYITLHTYYYVYIYIYYEYVVSIVAAETYCPLTEDEHGAMGCEPCRLQLPLIALSDLVTMPRRPAILVLLKTDLSWWLPFPL